MSLPERVSLGELTLKRWRLEDAKLLTTAVRDNYMHLSPWMPWAKPHPTVWEYSQIISEWENQWESGESLSYGLFVKGAVVGSSGIHRWSDLGVREIGYWVHKNYLRQGYATKATKGLIAIAFDIPGVKYVEIRNDEANAGSVAIPKKLGFNIVSKLSTERPLLSGEKGVMFVWRVSKENWIKRGQAERI